MIVAFVLRNGKTIFTNVSRYQKTEVNENKLTDYISCNDFYASNRGTCRKKTMISTMSTLVKLYKQQHPTLLSLSGCSHSLIFTIPGNYSMKP